MGLPPTIGARKASFFEQNTLSDGFKRTTCNFLEAGHGEGPAAGIGAAVKRQTDSLVANGIDLPNGSLLFEQLSKQPSTVKLMYVTVNEIEEVDGTLPDALQTIQGTMQIHQVNPFHCIHFIIIIIIMIYIFSFFFFRRKGFFNGCKSFMLIHVLCVI